MIRLKAIYLSDTEIANLMYSEGVNENVYHKLKKTLESKEYSTVFEA